MTYRRLGLATGQGTPAPATQPAIGNRQPATATGTGNRQPATGFGNRHRQPAPAPGPTKKVYSRVNIGDVSSVQHWVQSAAASAFAPEKGCSICSFAEAKSNEHL